MFYGNSGLRKTWLDKCLQRAVKEYPSKSNMINEPKNCPNLNGGTFTTFIELREGN